MTVNLELSPEREAALKAQAQARGLTVEQWLIQLVEEAQAFERPAGQETSPLWDGIAAIINDVPAEEFAKLPRDGASQHDHYLYGQPKRPE